MTTWHVTGKGIDLTLTTQTDNRREALLKLEEAIPAEQRECLMLKKERGDDDPKIFD